jgi:hypothetical protein
MRISNKYITYDFDISKCGCFKKLGIMFEIEKYSPYFTIYRFTIGLLICEIELRICVKYGE